MRERGRARDAGVVLGLQRLLGRVFASSSAGPTGQRELGLRVLELEVASRGALRREVHDAEQPGDEDDQRSRRAPGRSASTLTDRPSGMLTEVSRWQASPRCAGTKRARTQGGSLNTGATEDAAARRVIALPRGIASSPRSRGRWRPRASRAAPARELLADLDAHERIADATRTPIRRCELLGEAGEVRGAAREHDLADAERAGLVLVELKRGDELARERLHLPLSASRAFVSLFLRVKPSGTSLP